MRINKYIALHTGISRRKADELIISGQVTVNNQPANSGYEVQDSDNISVNGNQITNSTSIQTIMLNKPVGYVCSRDGQGSKTIYDLLEGKYQNLKPIGRLDKDSSGLLLLTNDGDLANKLTHPRFEKIKVYQVKLDIKLAKTDMDLINQGVELSDGVSNIEVSGTDEMWTIKMTEGRNRQIRRTFASLNYTVVYLHRTQIGEYSLGNLGSGKYTRLN